MEDDLFNDYQERLDILGEDIRAVALKYAKDFHLNNKCSKEEALERGIVKAEMDKRKLVEQNYKNMDWMFQDFRTDLDGLNPKVREKALEIAKELVEKKDLPAKEALQQAIMRAEEWFYDIEG